jgi:hypothetical protein
MLSHILFVYLMFHYDLRYPVDLPGHDWVVGTLLVGQMFLALLIRKLQRKLREDKGKI